MPWAWRIAWCKRIWSCVPLSASWSSYICMWSMLAWRRNYQLFKKWSMVRKCYLCRYFACVACWMPFETWSWFERITFVWIGHCFWPNLCCYLVNNWQQKLTAHSPAHHTANSWNVHALCQRKMRKLCVLILSSSIMDSRIHQMEHFSVETKLLIFVTVDMNQEENWWHSALSQGSSARSLLSVSFLVSCACNILHLRI